MAKFSLQLPTDASKVESFLHKICDAHGFTNTVVSSDGTSLIVEYPDGIAPHPSLERHVDSVPGLRC